MAFLHLISGLRFLFFRMSLRLKLSKQKPRLSQITMEMRSPRCEKQVQAWLEDPEDQLLGLRGMSSALGR